jgi:hypothetical protein
MPEITPKIKPKVDPNIQPQRRREPFSPPKPKVNPTPKG